MDLKLLMIFDEVYKTRSTSRASENLGIPQSSVSVGLARLRRYYSDPLFVRTAEGMLPTPYATELRRPLHEALELLQKTTQQRASFIPENSKRSFHVCMTDISHLVLLPKLVNRLSEIAPGICLEITYISGKTAGMLASGDADLAVGYMPELNAGFYQQKLFEQSFTCVVRQNHPRVQEQLSLTQFKRERHAVIIAAGTGHELVERTLEHLGVERQIALVLPNFLGIGGLVASTDLMVTVPQRVAETLMRIANVKQLLPPVDLPKFSIKQHWHERFHHDPPNQWLRSVISELFLEF